jgi:2'-5' RNA ligase
MAEDCTAAAGTARLFIALWPDEALREALLSWCAQWQWNAAAKRVAAHRLHLTLHFLGDGPRKRLSALRQALAVPFAPFSLSLGRASLWTGGVAVVETEHLPPHLARLHTALGDALTGLGLPTESRAFRPHVTVARRAQTAAAPASGPCIVWAVERYVLVDSSAPRADGYRIVQAYA